jgi:hypothetical protein
MATKLAHTVVEAATVLCVRASRHRSPSRLLTAKDYVGSLELSAEASKQLGSFEWRFESGLQLLLGQSEVVNYVRSTSPEKLSMMRAMAASSTSQSAPIKDEGENEAVLHWPLHSP